MWKLAWLAVIMIVALGSVLDVMEVDAAQYASMSRVMSVSPDWLQLHWREHDYLDKPPLLFWLSALSFKLFGVHNWSYKLPSILFAFAGVYATFRFTRLFHTVEVARTAALMWASSAAFVLMTNDVRCDTILTACVMLAIWSGAEYLQHRRWKHLIACSIAVALGMLAKGPIGLMAPLLALGLPLFVRKRWSALRDPRLLVVPVIVGFCLIPMCIGLYQQHGMHGIRFFFWEQSFGRITGASRWNDDSTPLFFTHEVLWQLLPWTLFALAGLFSDARAWIRKGASSLQEITTLCGAVAVFLAMSFSRYKLPHYIYPILPLLCVIAARQLHRGLPRSLIIAQNALALLLLIAPVVLLARTVAGGGAAWACVLLSSALLAGLVWWRGRDKERELGPSLIAVVMCAFVLNVFVYPFLLRFQANAMAGHWVHDRTIPTERFFGFRAGGAALDFYSWREVPWLGQPEQIKEVMGPGLVVYTDVEGKAMLENAGLGADSVITYEQYPVQSLDLRFFDPMERISLLDRRFLLLY